MASQAPTAPAATGPTPLQPAPAPVLPESAGTPWASRDRLRPSAAGPSSLWALEASHFGGRQLWGCAHCGSTATRFKGLRDHHSGRHGGSGLHRDHPFDPFICCINNPDRPVPRVLIPEIREAAIKAINQGKVLPHNLQRFNQFYTGPGLPAYPPGRVPAGFGSLAPPPPPPPPPAATTAAPAAVVVPVLVAPPAPILPAVPAPAVPALAIAPPTSILAAVPAVSGGQQTSQEDFDPDADWDLWDDDLALDLELDLEGELPY